VLAKLDKWAAAKECTRTEAIARLLAKVLGGAHVKSR